MDRVASECDFEQDLIDRRILYEMLGERLHPEDFLDESSESDNDANADGVDDDSQQPAIPSTNEQLLI